jgi:CBS domain-containing protein
MTDGLQGTGANVAVLVDEIMQRDVLTTGPGVPVEEAARMMRAHGVSGIPVVDGSGVLVGVVTEYDIVSKRGAHVGDIMSRGVITVAEGTSAARVVDLVGLHGIRGIPVIREGTLAGLVTRADLVDLFLATRWVCESCNAVERGIAAPAACATCGSATWHLERAEP